eukprot:TRINITY_DN3350_c0_g1_i3.p2 TRINITY_DN3350_c0_g1~~TRINITY_DN3350_c0_g1_i3.p2  ORF type:complete len:107 (-),score=28.97 TRINITY_DN3350_c0_g1_i3:598-918(-)
MSSCLSLSLALSLSVSLSLSLSLSLSAWTCTQCSILMYLLQVLVYFNNKVMRGNRVTKSDAESLDAFATPQIDPIATLGVTVKIEWNDVFHNEMDGQPFTVCIIPS